MKAALRVNTDFTTEVLDLSENEYEQLFEAVGGLIEAADLDADLTLWCNEEGKLIGLTPNIIATKLWEKSFGPTDIILGDCVFTGGTDEDGETRELPHGWLVQLQELAARIRKAVMTDA
ncbi:MAG: DUF3846 domain-containing protein [Actinobacteria bacterium]|jgi:hypothetical protein|nr:DUF3846 domain-containing protein [Actinomycetota bacterium]NDA96191.1 DUF3846 domain-containing protein [Actinomycetota bacterium]NDI00013.1 DUF3846 domain-containing protein [Actinomycetota bacterium]